MLKFGHLKNIYSNNNFMIVVLILLLAIPCERITINAGLGFDGALYGQMVRNFSFDLFNLNVDAYSIQRILPIAIVSIAMKLLNISSSASNIISAFIILNSLLLVFSCMIWMKLVSVLNISVSGKWLGFFAVFVSVFFKHFTFHPVTTDVFAMFLGFCLVYCYVTKQGNLVLFVSVLGAFVWPTLLYSGVLLYVFENRQSLHKSGYELSEVWRILPYAISTLLSLFALVALLYTWYFDGVGFAKVGEFSTISLPGLGFLGIGIACAYIFISSYSILKYVFNIEIYHYFRLDFLARLCIAIVAIVAVRYFIEYYSQGAPRATASRFLSRTLFVSTLKPGIFFVSHVAYFGAIFIVGLILFRRVARIASTFGLGALLYLSFFLALAISPESRLLVNFLPFFALLCVMAFDELKIHAR